MTDPSRIMIVEDEFIVAQDLQRTVERLGHRVCGIAPSGDRAVAMARELTPDLILMDIILRGGMDGIEAARTIQERSEVPVIYLTAYADPATIERVKNTEPFGYLVKPFKDRELDANIRMALYRSRNEKKLRAADEAIELNEFLQREIAHRKEVEQDLKASKERLQVLSAKLIGAQEEERRRVANEIHDSIGSSLTAIKYAAQEAIREAGAGDPGVIRSLEEVIAQIRRTIEEARRISTNLRPSMIDDLGLIPTIHWFCREFSKIYDGIEVDHRLDVAESRVGENLKIVIYRIIQEALNNVAKHSGARRARVFLEGDDEWIRLTVEDDGRGIGPGEPRRETGRVGSAMGLRSMKGRAELLGGDFEIGDSPEGGVRIRAAWPVSAPEALGDDP